MNDGKLTASDSVKITAQSVSPRALLSMQEETAGIEEKKEEKERAGIIHVHCTTNRQTCHVISKELVFQY